MWIFLNFFLKSSFTIQRHTTIIVVHNFVPFRSITKKTEFFLWHYRAMYWINVMTTINEVNVYVKKWTFFYKWMYKKKVVKNFPGLEYHEAWEKSLYRSEDVLLFSLLFILIYESWEYVPNTHIQVDIFIIII